MGELGELRELRELGGLKAYREDMGGLWASSGRTGSSERTERAVRPEGISGGYGMALLGVLLRLGLLL